MSEKLCLQWNDYKENVIGAFGSLREDKDFTDVTLACEDGKQVETHKVILAASSPFFKGILSMNKHPHPLIFMRGLKSHDLLAILDFLYCGEANVYQENLDSFLVIADELQLKGLMGKADKEEETQTKRVEIPLPEKMRQVHKSKESISKALDTLQTNVRKDIVSYDGGAFFLTGDYSEDLKELDEQCNSQMEKTSNKSTNGKPLYRCQVCGKEETNTNMKDHIEANHLEGISIPCKLCQKTFRSRAALRMHKRNHYRSI